MKILPIAQRIEQQPSKLLVGGSSPSGQAKQRPSGGIGRHKGLKIPRLIACRFESGLGYQKINYAPVTQW